MVGTSRILAFGSLHRRAWRGWILCGGGSSRAGSKGGAGVGDGERRATSGVIGLFTSICGSNLGLVSGSAMAVDSSQNDGLFIDGKSWECVYRKISAPSLFQCEPTPAWVSSGAIPAVLNRLNRVL